MTTDAQRLVDRRPVEPAATDPAFEAVYVAHREAILRFLLSIQPDRDLALDLAALTFERALRETQRGRTVGLGWLLRTARNAAVDASRRARVADLFLGRFRPGEERAPSAEDLVVVTDEAARVRAAVLRLPTPQREAIVLRYGTDLTVSAIARVIGKSDAATEKLIARGLVRLREVLHDIE